MNFMNCTGERKGKVILGLASFVLALFCGAAATFTFHRISNFFERTRTIGGDFISETSLDEDSITGRWQGEWEGVPAVFVKIEKTGPLTGTARFVRVIKTGSGPRSDGSTEELPLINPSFDGHTLSFKVWNGSMSDNRIEAEIEMHFLNQNEAELQRVGGIPEGKAKDKGLVIKMIRQD